MLSEPTLRIRRLQSGGLITNYFCTSRCRHCLYNCSPRWPKKYITADAAEKNLATIQSLGCGSIHIGGGEPLLRPDALIAVLDAAASSGVHIDYVETNSAWYRGADSAVALLGRLKRHGLHTLLISISPFHNEHTPFAQVEGVMTAARRAGIGLFPWVEGFVPDLASFDPQQTHHLKEFEAHFGRDYRGGILRRYWIHLGGRALHTFRDVLPAKRFEDVLDDSCAAELADTSHFHLDLFGNYIPGLCAGLAIARTDLGTALSASDYPVLQRLYTRGVRGLYEWARKRFDFRPVRDGYLNKCDLCTEIRSKLVRSGAKKYRELQPIEFYFLR